MKKTQKLSSFASTRWAFLSVVGVVLVFAGFATYQMVSAQTTTSFTDPTCDPTTNPGSCNTPQPLFLTPKTGQTGPQIVETDVQIGKTGALKDLSLYAGIVLSDSTKNISTISGYSGQAIHATSTLGHAIYGSSGGNGTGGLYGIATSATAYGVAGSSGGYGTYAVFADASTGGTAGKFIGPVIYQNGSNTATLAVDGTGNLNVTTSVTGKGFTVNGIPAAGAEKTVVVASQPTTTTYDVKANVLSGSQFAISSIQVLYRDTTSGNRFWQPLASTAITYEECTGNSFTGSLKLTNPVASPEYRLVIGYDPTTTFVCTGQDVTPPDSVSITGGVTSNYWYGSNVTITATATDTNGTIQKVQFFDGATQIGVDDTTAPYSVVWAAGSATTSYPAGPYHSITAKAYSNGVATPTTSTAVANVKTFTSSDNRQVCSNTTTCSTSQYCCLSSTVNDGQPTTPINKCTNSAATPPTCQPASNYCGACQGGSTPPPEV